MYIYNNFFNFLWHYTIMTDNLTKEQRTKNMKAIKSSHTKMEDYICKVLWKEGFRFRKNVKNLPGKPDIAIKKFKIVIFLDSCFWHKCPEHFKKPKSNLEYWDPKIERNVKRDIEVNKFYNDNQWHILRIWEHEFKNNLDATINKIETFINTAK